MATIGGDPTTVNEGDLAFARSIQDLADIFLGIRATAVRFTRWSSPTLPTLDLANRTPGGPVLRILRDTLDEEDPLMVITNEGFDSFVLDGFIDWGYQAVAPAAPGVGTGKLRMYARAGQLYFKAEGSGELQIPIGTPPGPTMRYAFWNS